MHFCVVVPAVAALFRHFGASQGAIFGGRPLLYRCELLVTEQHDAVSQSQVAVDYLVENMKQSLYLEKEESVPVYELLSVVAAQYNMTAEHYCEVLLSNVTVPPRDVVVRWCSPCHRGRLYCGGLLLIYLTWCNHFYRSV